MNYRILLLLCLFVFRCATVEHKSTRAARLTPEWGPVEIKQTVRTMASSLKKFFVHKNRRPFLELGELRNKSSEHINTNLITSELTSSLLQEEITFVDKSKREAAIKEAKLAQEGLVQERSAIPAGEFLSPNYVLEGTIDDNVRYERSVKTQYIVVTLRLTEVASGAIRWQKQKKFLKVSRRKVVDW